MNVKNIDFVNIILMLLSFLLALIFPLETFLFAYAVFGPFHYLTEISWLKDRNFFLPSGSYSILIGGLGLIAVVLSFLALPVMFAWTAFLTFLLAFVFSLLKTWKTRIISVCLIGLIFFTVLQPISIQFLILAIFTFVHVYLFTGLFILVGAVKSKSKMAFASLVVFALCGVGLLFVPIPGLISTSPYLNDSYLPMTDVNKMLLNIFYSSDYLIFSNSDYHLNGNLNGNAFLQSVLPGMVSVMRFIAFAYVYHYLNWFSKTSIIQWHKTSKFRLSVILFVWGFSVMIYWLNYKIGFTLLFALSFIHVVLEFPLNFKVMNQLFMHFNSLALGKIKGN